MRLCLSAWCCSRQEWQTAAITVSIMYPVDPRTQLALEYLTLSGFGRGFGPQRVAERVHFGHQPQQLDLRPPSPPSSDPTLSDRKIDEYRRSLFIPDVPRTVTFQQLSTTFRLFGSVQEIFQRESSGSAIVIFVEGESAFDALKARVIIDNLEIYCEPRRINGKVYAPNIPMDVETPARIQTQSGGRGIPYSIVASLPTVPGSAYAHDYPAIANGPKNAPYDGPVATRAPVLAAQPSAPAVFPPQGHALPDSAHLLPNRPLPLPVQQKRPMPQKKETQVQKLLRQMPYLNTLNDPYMQMVLLMQNAELNPEEYRQREQIRSELERSFRKIFRRCDLRMYGSSVNTFGVRGSDIDSYLELYLDSEEAQKDLPPRENYINYYNNNVTQLFNHPYEPAELKKFTKQQILRLMEKLHRYLAKSHGWDNIFAVPEARTPILKLHQSYTNMSIDVSFSSKLVFQNTGLLILYSMMDHRIRPLVYTIRRWADTKELTGDMGFTKYALTMLLLFFLYNTKPVVVHPPEQIIAWIESSDEYRKRNAETSSENQISSAFSFDLPVQELQRLARTIPASLNQRSPAQLLMDFFAFYASFDFSRNIMSAFTGEAIPVQSFEVPPEGFRFRYVNLQDPFDMPHNIAKSVSLHTFIQMREWMRQEVAVFSKIPLNLITLFDKDYTESCLPAIPVAVSISAHKSKTPFAEWIPKVADVTKRIFEDFFRCESVRELTEADAALTPFDRAIPQLGPVLNDYHCVLKCRSWDKRRLYRKTAIRGMKIGSLKDEWSLEASIGDLLHKQTSGKVSLEFYVTIMENKCETDKVCVYLTSATRSDEIGEFFELLWKYLPDQIRRFLKVDDVAVEVPPPLTGESVPEDAEQRTEDLEVGA